MKIFVTRKLPGGALDKLNAFCDVDVWTHESPPSKQDIIARAKDCEGLITLLSDEIDRTVLDALPCLRVISQYAVGYNNIDVEEATRRGIIITNTPGVLTEATADLTWALILAVARRIPESDRYVREGEWNVAWGPELMLGREVYGTTLGIIGMGRIGYAVAKRSKGFGMRIIYHSRSETEMTQDAEVKLGAKRVSLEELLREADVISLHVPLTEDTRNLITKRELSLMKNSAILINTARGPVINEKDLYEHLRNRQIFGAGLDVFEAEPIDKENPLLGLENVVVTPHTGSATTSTRNKMAEIVVNDIMAALRGIPPKHIVNSSVLINQ